MSLQKSEIKLEANGKPLNAYLVSPSSGGAGLLVLPSWFGLKPYFKRVCDRLAQQGYTASVFYRVPHNYLNSGFKFQPTNAVEKFNYL